MKNIEKNVFESAYEDLYDNGELYTLDECDGGGDAGGAAGGDASPGGDAGPGGGITSDAVLGPDGGMEKGEGCLSKGDFHVPFPVMPCLFRYPCCNGGSKNRKKKGKKTVSVKNPYVKGMKTIVAEGEAFQYMGQAREKFDEMTQDVDNVFTGVLTFNRKWRLAWLVNENGILEFYKPIQEYDGQTREPKPDGIWKIYHTKLTPEGAIQLLDKSNASYRTEEDALSAIWQEVKSHQEQLKECLASAGRAMDESRFSPRDLINWEAHGRDPRYFPKERKPAVNVRALEQELKRKFYGQFEDVQISDRIGRWTVQFKAPVPDGRREISGQQRVASVIPQVNRIISFMRMRGIEVNSYDVSVRAN